jgi:hypothetical protein
VKKRRVTLNLAQDAAHRAAMLRWLDELDARYGAPTAQELTAADALLAAVARGDDLDTADRAA